MRAFLSSSPGWCRLRGFGWPEMEPESAAHQIASNTRAVTAVRSLDPSLRWLLALLVCVWCFVLWRVRVWYLGDDCGGLHLNFML